jgi:hypothetical protein
MFFYLGRVVVVVAALSGCGDHISAKQCAAMFDHYGELKTREDPRFADMTAAQKRLMPSMQRALINADRVLGPMAQSCSEKVTRAQHDCASQALSAAAWRKCFE